ncbi:MAG: threonine--tRNA ligase [Crenarchaeota archaeon]|nr:threonine--tRNA ligase [Thermoproteota archaeon]
MRILLIHAERFAYEAVQRAIDSAEDVPEDRRRGCAENALVAMCTVESVDEQNPEEVASRAAEEIASVARKVGAKRVVVYPYAHLSSDLADPYTARKVLELTEAKLREMGFETLRAPFGWYKKFEISCYGHPLSELSRTVRPGRAAERRAVEKKYLIMTPDGALHDPREFDYGGDEDLRTVVEKEALRKELEGGTGRVHYYLRKFGFEWEPMSDHGHMRYEPHADTIFEAVQRYSWLVAQSLGIPIFKVRGTNMFSLSYEPVRKHAELFGERMYEVRMGSDRFVLRFAACHQQFSILRDWVLSYRDLPMGMFEVADSYRYEQRGEIVLGFRVRKFHMPDLHILTKSLEEAAEIVLSKVMPAIHREAAKLGRRYVAIYNVTQDFLENHRETLRKFVEREGRPVLLAVYPAGIYYWVINVEYTIVDEMGRPREIATWQIDVGNARRFGIRYRDSDGSERYPVIIHTALIGSVERYIYMVFDTAAHAEKSGSAPTLPTWLAPIQVRIIPVSRDHLSYAESIARELLSRGIRVDIDDREESLGRKIRDAGVEWVPYVVVVGDREVKTGTLNVRIRSSGVQRSMTLNELVELLEKDLEGYPRVEQSLPIKMSSRPALPYLRQLSK